MFFFLSFFGFNKKMQKVKGQMSDTSALTGICWAVALEPFELYLILGGVYSLISTNYCSNPFGVFYYVLFVNVIYDNETTITLKWRKNAFTSIKVLVVTTIYNIYKQYFHLPIALFGKYTTKMGDLVVYHKQNYPIYSILHLYLFRIQF